MPFSLSSVVRSPQTVVAYHSSTSRGLSKERANQQAAMEGLTPSSYLFFSITQERYRRLCRKY